jgi:hypothetical protein
MGEILNLLTARESGENIQPSTKIAETGAPVIITSFGALRSKTWCVLRSLKEEAGLYTQLMHQTIYREIGPEIHTETTAAEISKPPSSPERSSLNFEMKVKDDIPQSITSHTHTSTREKPKLVQANNNMEEKVTSINETSLEDIFAVIDEAVRAKDWDKVKYVLEDTTILTSTDTGGQAEFMDLHTTLVHGPSFNLLFYRLVDELDKEFEAYYTDECGRSTEKECSILTVEEILFQALSSIACCSGAFCDSDSISRSDKTSTKLPDPSNSVVMFVGTHRDLVEKDHFEQKDKILKEIIKRTAFYDKGIIKFAEDGQLILSVNNLDGDQDELDMIRHRLGEVIEKCFQKIRIPVSWLVLSLHIRSKAVRTMTLGECEDVAQKLGIGSEEVREALWFLHRHVGVLLYYPELEELRNTVICDIQVVFDSATNLIKNTFTFDTVEEKVREVFRTKGQFTLQDVQKAMSCHTDALIPPKKLIKLLKHLNILTEIPSEGEGNNPAFFMPCVLRNAKCSELTTRVPEESDPAPLLLYYECGYVPAGLFPAMITNLLSQQREDWEMIQEGLFKNRVEFFVGEDLDTVTLISHPRFLEIVLLRAEEFETPSDEMCARILDVIQCTLRAVTSRMNNFKMECRFGFKCPDHTEMKHICEMPKRTSRKMLCLLNPNRKRVVSLQPRHKVWFENQCGARGMLPDMDCLCRVSYRGG